MLKGYSTFFESLEPTPSELAARQPRLLELLSHRRSSIVTFALEQLDRLQKQSALDSEAFLSAARAVFLLKPKTQSKTALQVAARIAAKQPELVPAAVNLTIEALAHDAADVQEQAVGMLEGWLPRAHPDHAAALRERLASVSATVRSRLEAIVSQLAGTTANEAAIEPATCTRKPTSASLFSGPNALDPRWRKLAGVDEALDAPATASAAAGIVVRADRRAGSDGSSADRADRHGG